MSVKKNLKLILALFRYKKKSFAVVLLFVSVLAAFFDGVDDKTSVELYLQKMQDLSDYCISDAQKHLVTYYYLKNSKSHPPKARRKKIRHEFNSLKLRLRREWSARYSLKWPVSASGYFQAHHIIPINSGGINKWWNISPISDENHKKLHSSPEEHACFSHDFVERKVCRLFLRIREFFCNYLFRFPAKNLGTLRLIDCRPN